MIDLNDPALEPLRQSLVAYEKARRRYEVKKGNLLTVQEDLSLKQAKYIEERNKIWNVIRDEMQPLIVPIDDALLFR